MRKDFGGPAAGGFERRIALSNRLSDFDLEQFFQLNDDDMAAIGKQFRTGHRAPAALMVLFMRAAGRPLDRFTVLPRSLLRYVGERFNTTAPTIASLRAIYQRSQTLYKHQLWAKNHIGLKELDPMAEADLVAMLALHAAEASHPDDLVTSACHWLYDHRILIPGPRRVLGWARDAFATIEAHIRQAIDSEVTPAVLQRCRESAYSLRPDGEATHLEWLKTPSKRHGSTTVAETLERIHYLKTLGVHEWPLGGIALPKQRAYAQQVQARRPAKTRELKEARQTIELVCFLRVSLLELTDVAMHQGARRSQQLFREATQKAKASRDRSDSVARNQARLARDVLRDPAKALHVRCAEADQLQGLARKTVRRHRDNLWALGGELVRRRYEDDELARMDVSEALQQLMQGDGGPFMASRISEAEQDSLDATCRKLRRFLSASSGTVGMQKNTHK